ncbi:nucleoside-diphosphate sugar epimerase/dehydratase [Desulfopila sp. IMCC35006]|uniref:polysaccharide biosynthesis protein n=1 Tax=Desulfopila sp. IMCC35006 TaxID=2569542 RepID=UPI001F107324|nr:nucleoside-diphosphate sugar epimerase/dehydratase [Desulfopila sp. IMCC35006]
MEMTFIKRLKEQPRLLWTLARRRNFWIVLLVDIVLIVAAFFLAYLVRFDSQISWWIPQIASVLPFMILCKIPIFYMFGLYRGMWRYASTTDLLNITKAVAVSSGFIIMSVLYFNRFIGFSRSVFVMDGVFTFLLLCLHRGTIRFFLQNKEQMPWLVHDVARQDKVRLLLIGAGAAAEKVIREIRDNNNVPYEVVGLVDDDRSKQGLKIHGIPVVGGLDNLQQCIARTRPAELLIAVASATAEQMQRIVDLCQKSETKFKVLPSMGEIIRGKLSVTSSREIAYKDLLGRPVVHLDQEEIGRYLTGRTVLVTGAGGSIGSELCRQIIRFEPKKIILLDAGEENLYKIQMELHHDHHFHDYVPVLCKIQNQPLLNAIFTEYAPSVVFHAAAYKHVPLVEANPWEAVFNNVFATKGLIEATIAHKVERFVLVSTDKAVRPTNVMGATKRVTELLMLAYCHEQSAHSSAGNKNNTAFMAVRFGNVLGSSGSVIPLFKQQIEKGGPVTVTDPEMTRYFMSIEEAAQLILQAGAMGGGGEIFILKMGARVKIVNLARDLIKLLGYEPEKDIKIEYTGLRAGEKLYEELITEGEGIVPTKHEKIMVLLGNGKSEPEMEELLRQLAKKATLYDARGIKEILQEILPEYTPDLQAVSIVQAFHASS